VFDSFWEKARYLFLLVVYSIFYFIRAILEGVWGLIKSPFNKK
jgi:hypothetical protein